jgi:hypothetical protein
MDNYCYSSHSAHCLWHNAEPQKHDEEHDLTNWNTIIHDSNLKLPRIPTRGRGEYLSWLLWAKLQSSYIGLQLLARSSKHI